MIINVGGHYPEVRDADDCGRFHVETVLAAADLDQALQVASAGHADEDGEAWVAVDWVRSAVGSGAGVNVGADWPERFAAMLDYARGKDWLNDSGTHVRAHVVRAAS